MTRHKKLVVEKSLDAVELFSRKKKIRNQQQKQKQRHGVINIKGTRLKVHIGGRDGTSLDLGLEGPSLIFGS